jgi:MoaA/NifB/PqqE/SkfB family radical SAM enzyme
MLKVLLIKARELLLRGSVLPAFFDITSRCNLACPHCYFFRGRQTRTLAFKEWEALFAEYRRRHFKHVVLSGGEPTLNQDVIFLADEFFPIVNIATNGLVKVPPAIEHTILVSLDGQKETHEQVRGKGTFERVLANYEGDKRVIYRMTITRLNLGQVEQVARTARQNGVRGVSYIIHAPDSESDDLCLDAGELEEARASLLTVIDRHRGFVYLTPRMVDSMVRSDFGQNCRLRASVALYSDGTPKKCSMNNIDCAKCKCPTPALLHNYRRDARTFLLGLRFY